MATMSDDELQKQRRKMASELAVLIRRQLRDMRRRMTKPRAYRLPKEARMLKSLLAEARDAGLVPPLSAKSSRLRGGAQRHARANTDRDGHPPIGGLQVQHGAG